MSATLLGEVWLTSISSGVDLIADVFPRLLETDPKIQLIAVGPVVDLYGRLAAVKLQRLVEMYPGRVYSKPEFTALYALMARATESVLTSGRAGRPICFPALIGL